MSLPVHNDAILHTDARSIYKKAVESKWQNDWAAVDQRTGRRNKLHRIKETVKLWISSSNRNRKHEVVLTRLRIGHCKLTHGHLMEGHPPPFCLDCLVPLTVKHVLAECPSYQQQRRRYLSILPNRRDADNLMKELPEDSRGFNIDLIIEFLKAINIYSQI